MTNSLTVINTKYIPSKNLNPFFEVKRCALYADNNGRVDTNRDGLFSENGDLLGIVSKRYSLVENKDVKTVFDDFFSKYKIHSIKDKVSTNGDKWIREYILDEDDYTVVVDNDDVLKTRVSIYNGYDGKTSVGLDISFFRQVCSNGMMGWKNAIGTKFSHFSNDIISKLENTLDNGFKNIVKNVDTFDEWSKIPFKEKDFEKFIDSRKYLSKKQKKATNGLYLPIKSEFKEKDTKWGGYNVLTAIATHHTASRNKDVDNVFSNGYKTISRVTKDFFEYEVV